MHYAASRLVVLALIMGCASSALFTQGAMGSPLLMLNSLEYLRVQFTRSLYAPSSTPDIVSGTMYFTPTGLVHIEITSPIIQHISLTGKEMTIYYPKERKAFVFSSQNPLSLPFASAFIGATRESMGLSDLGFSTSTISRSSDTIISTWIPPASARTSLQKVVLAELNGVVVRSESFDAKGALSTRAVYKNYVSIKQGQVPLEIYGGWQSKNGWTRENLEFTDPSTVDALPPHVNDFKIPSDVTPRKVQW
jgi:hypothetical protein